MELSIRLLSNVSSSVPVMSIQDVLECEIVSDITSVDTATIKVPLSIEGITALMGVEIYSVKGPEDTLLFRGYIDQPLPKLNDGLTLICKEEKGIFAKKIVMVDRVLNGQTPSAMITQLFADWNSAWGEQFTIDSSITGTTDKEFKDGDTFLDAFDALAQKFGAVWDVYRGEMRMEVLLGTDYTDPANFKELVYDGEDIGSSNIYDVSNSGSSDVTNIVMASDGTIKTTVNDSASRTQFGPLAEYKSMRVGDLSGTAQAYLDSKKGIMYSFSMTPEYRLFEAHAGDKVHLRIENASSYLNFEGDVIISKKTSTLTNGSLIAKYEISQSYAKKDDFINRFVQVEKDIALSNL